MMKWCLVAAGLKDLNRPAEKLSVSQNVGAWPLSSLPFKLDGLTYVVSIPVVIVVVPVGVAVAVGGVIVGV